MDGIVQRNRDFALNVIDEIIRDGKLDEFHVKTTIEAYCNDLIEEIKNEVEFHENDCLEDGCNLKTRLIGDNR